MSETLESFPKGPKASFPLHSEEDSGKPIAFSASILPDAGSLVSDPSLKWLWEKGEKALGERNLAQAIPIFEKILAIGRRHKKIRLYANLQLAFIYEQFKDFVKVKNYFLKAVSLDPDNPELRYQFAQMLSAMGRDREAIIALRAAINRGSQKVEYRSHLARNLSQLGRKQEAAKEFQKALEKFPDDVNILLHFSIHLIQDNKLLKAEKLLEQAEEKITTSENYSDKKIVEKKLGMALSLLHFQRNQVKKTENKQLKNKKLDIEKPPESVINVSSKNEEKSVEMEENLIPMKERFTHEGLSYVLCEDTFWVEDQDRQEDYERYLLKTPNNPHTFNQWRELDEEYVRLLYWSNLRDLTDSETERTRFLEVHLLGKRP